MNKLIFPEDIKLIKKLETELGTIFFYENFVVSKFNEGITLSYKSGFHILLTGLQFYSTTPFFYISLRENSYSVVPTDYKYLEKVHTLKALAVVNPYPEKTTTVSLESNFLNKPFQEFKTITEAYIWAKQFI